MLLRVRGLLAAAAIAASFIAASASAQTTQVFQPGFHQALRWSESHGSVVTYRLKVPVGRAGNRIRLTFMAGDGSLTIHKVTVARANGSGMKGATFDGQTSRSGSARQQIKTDAVSFPVAFGEELFVSFEASGHLATSAVLALPGSFRWSGNHAASFPGPLNGAWYRAIGLSTIDVEGAPTRAFVAIGDSITEGYINGNTWTYANAHDDYRNAWPAVFQKESRTPVANAGVAGQGVYEELQNLDREVKSLTGITDCIILLGTNDLPTATAEQIEAQLSQLFSRLNGFCRVWVSTLLPKEATQEGSFAEVVARRHAVNGWIRSLTNVAGVVDLEAVVKGADADHFKVGYAADHVHPSIAGHKAMGSYLASFFRPPPTLTIEVRPLYAEVPPLASAVPPAVIVAPPTPVEPTTATHEAPPPSGDASEPLGDALQPASAGCAAAPAAAWVPLALVALLWRRRR